MTKEEISDVFRFTLALLENEDYIRDTHDIPVYNYDKDEHDYKDSLDTKTGDHLEYLVLSSFGYHD